MGSLVWTAPSALKLQINRVDVFAADATTTSFPRADSDYASGCGYVDINLVDTQPPVRMSPTLPVARSFNARSPEIGQLQPAIATFSGHRFEMTDCRLQKNRPVILLYSRFGIPAESLLRQRLEKSSEPSAKRPAR